MAEMLFRTKVDMGPSGKARVYFTCHSDDFDLYFDKVCEYIFKTQNCAIYYTADMNEAMSDEDKATDLESCNLFVVPVTFKLLTTANRAMDDDIKFALERHIPVLPLMMESGLDAIYSRPDKFGELQYLSPFSSDETEVSFDEKLKKYLESILVSDETANRIRAAFDAYIFLSYRKKDRKYANQLMRIIHSKPECRDIAIWYDEFLTPGESFRENIDKILADSKLFTLLVTPNLLEDHNFVMDQEYPAAIKSGIEIIPAEMEKTDRSILAEKYANLPEISNPYDDDSFRKRLADTFARLAITSNDSDPEHNFLIGLAYLEGIDVEVDRERALRLITSAAEANLPEAIEKLSDMYENGTGVVCDRSVSVKWLEKLADLITDTISPVSCTAEQFDHYQDIFSRLAVRLNFMGHKKDSLAVRQRFFDYSRKYYSSHADSCSPIELAYAYYRMASVYDENDMADKARESADNAVNLAVNSDWELTEDNILDFISVCRGASFLDPNILTKYDAQLNKIIEKIDSIENLSSECLQKMARLMEAREDYASEGKYFYRSYEKLSKLLNERSTPELMNEVLRAITLIRRFEEDYGSHEAYLEYTHKAIDIHKQLVEKYKTSANELNRLSRTIDSENALGRLYSELKEAATAYSHHKNAYYSAVELSKKHPSPDNYQTLSSCLSKLIDVLETFARRENADAIRTMKGMKIECVKRIAGLYENADSLPERLKLDNIITSYRTISSQYLSLDDYDNAILYAHKVLDASQQIYDMTKDLFTIYNAYQYISRMYESKGDYSAAFDYLRKGFEYEKVDLCEIDSSENRKTLAYRTEKLGELAYKANDEENGQKYYTDSARLRVGLYNENKDKRTAMSLYYLLSDFRKHVKDEKMSEYLRDKMDEIKKYWPDI
ncbi:MAG: toll/interleukin-1 receptor domain-containing protein [Clostridia bacterium]|nr:toll/interleukin-1 receptor domain-containing protein [Clostridia bacterium]